MLHPSDKTHRDLFRGSLELLVLAVLADGRRYGYAIQKQLKHDCGQSVQAGSLYPLLHRLESAGLVAATWDKSSARERKWYELTPAGQKQLRKSAADWQAYIARLQGLVLPAVRRVATQTKATDSGD
ncbi:MAG: PadR family transcriptional regulator [Phycisphaeraceae bacterium]